MPASDQCEQQVVNALVKAGWNITHRPYAIRVDQERASYVYADLRLQHDQDNETIIVVEVKCFAENRPSLEQLYQAVGQYIAYQSALRLNSIITPVFLSVPSDVFDTFFQKPLPQNIIHSTALKIIVVDLDREEIVRWIT